MSTGKTLIGASIMAAIASSLCCTIPLIAAIASFSGAASSVSWIEPARPYLLVLTVVILATSWYMHLRPKKTEKDDCGCEVNEKKGFVKSTKFLVIITIFAAIMTSFPFYSHIFYADGAKSTLEIEAGNLGISAISIEGMTCTGCENHINSALIAHVAVYEAISSYDDGSALVKYDKSKVEINELVALVETETGYTVLGFEIIENAE